MNKQKIAYNTIVQIIGRVITTLFGLITIGLLLRYLNQTGYGSYTTILAFVGIFSTLTDLGLYIIHVREISKIKDHSKITSNILTLRLVSGLIIIGLAPVIGYFMPYPSIVKVGMIIAVAHFLFISLNQILIGIFQKNLSMLRTVVSDLLGRAILLAGIFIVINQGLDLLAIIYVLALSSLTTFLSNLIQAKKFTKISLQFDTRYWKKVLSWSWPIALSIAFNLIYFKIGTIILSVIKSQAEVGIFGAGFKILEILIAVPASFVGLLMPYMSLHAHKNPKKFKKVLSQGFYVLSLLALPMVTGAWFIATPLLTFLGKESFSPSGRVLQIVAIAAGFIFLGQIFSSAVVALNKQKMMMWGYLTVAITAIVLNLVLIPRFSYLGASWAVVVTEFIIMLWAMALVSRTVGGFVNLSKLPKIIMATLAMAVALYLLSGAHVLVLIITGVIVYIGTLLLIKGIDREAVWGIVKGNNS